MEFLFRAFFRVSGPETHIGELVCPAVGFVAPPIIQGWKKTREYGKKKQVLEIVGAKEGTRTPTGVTPQEPEYGTLLHLTSPQPISASKLKHFPFKS